RHAAGGLGVACLQWVSGHTVLIRAGDVAESRCAPPKNCQDAIFCANDLMALGCYDALRELGLSIPDGVAVVGFDDREIARSMHPPLTMLVLPQYEMGPVGAEPR